MSESKTFEWRATDGRYELYSPEGEMVAWVKPMGGIEFHYWSPGNGYSGMYFANDGILAVTYMVEGEVCRNLGLNHTHRLPVPGVEPYDFTVWQMKAMSSKDYREVPQVEIFSLIDANGDTIYSFESALEPTEPKAKDPTPIFNEGEHYMAKLAIAGDTHAWEITRSVMFERVYDCLVYAESQLKEKQTHD